MRTQTRQRAVHPLQGDETVDRQTHEAIAEYLPEKGGLFTGT